MSEACNIKRWTRVVRKELSQDTGFPVFQNSLKPLGFYGKKNCDANTTFIIAAGAEGQLGFSCHDFWAADDCFCLCCHPFVKDKFLYYFLLNNQTFFMSQVRTASVPRLGRNVIYDFEIPIPSIERQKEIIAILDAFESLTTSLQSGLPAEIEMRKQQYEYYRNKLLFFKRAS
mgnify:CR=1 FL=1